MFNPYKRAKKISKSMKKKIENDKEYANKQKKSRSDVAKKLWENEEHREAMSKKGKERFKDDEFRKKHLDGTKRGIKRVKDMATLNELHDDLDDWIDELLKSIYNAEDEKGIKDIDKNIEGVIYIINEIKEILKSKE